MRWTFILQKSRGHRETRFLSTHAGRELAHGCSPEDEVSADRAGYQRSVISVIGEDGDDRVGQ